HGDHRLLEQPIAGRLRERVCVDRHFAVVDFVVTREVSPERESAVGPLVALGIDRDDGEIGELVHWVEIELDQLAVERTQGGRHHPGDQVARRVVGHAVPVHAVARRHNAEEPHLKRAPAQYGHLTADGVLHCGVLGLHVDDLGRPVHVRGVRRVARLGSLRRQQSQSDRGRGREDLPRGQSEESHRGKAFLEWCGPVCARSLGGMRKPARRDLRAPHGSTLPWTNVGLRAQQNNRLLRYTGHLFRSAWLSRLGSACPKGSGLLRGTGTPDCVVSQARGQYPAGPDPMTSLVRYDELSKSPPRRFPLTNCNGCPESCKSSAPAVKKSARIEKQLRRVRDWPRSARGQGGAHARGVEPGRRRRRREKPPPPPPRHPVASPSRRPPRSSRVLSTRFLPTTAFAVSRFPWLEAARGIPTQRPPVRAAQLQVRSEYSRAAGAAAEAAGRPAKRRLPSSAQDRIGSVVADPLLPHPHLFSPFPAALSPGRGRAFGPGAGPAGATAARGRAAVLAAAVPGGRRVRGAVESGVPGQYLRRVLCRLAAHRRVRGGVPGARGAGVGATAADVAQASERPESQSQGRRRLRSGVDGHVGGIQPAQGGGRHEARFSVSAPPSVRNDLRDRRQRFAVGTCR
ncbi:MAG: hypothetical protein BJ554DRAFT_5785, partial [Olpidium bornovanus]